MRGILVTAFVFLALGLVVLFAFCHGNAGVQFAYPLAGSTVHVEFTTRGIAAIAGFILTVLGAFMLVIATIIALVGLRSASHAEHASIKHRESAFEE